MYRKKQRAGWKHCVDEITKNMEKQEELMFTDALLNGGSEVYKIEGHNMSQSYHLQVRKS